VKEIILFSSTLSIQKSWQEALAKRYRCYVVESEDALFGYLREQKQAFIILADVSTTKDVESFIEACEKYAQHDLLLFHTEPTLARAIPLLRSRIKGYENAYINKYNLLNMVESVENGNRWFFTEVTNYLIQQFVKVESTKEPEFLELLTPTEKEIATMMAKGYTNKEIMQAKNIALSTVKGHIRKIFEKAEVSDRVSFVIKFKSF